MPFRRADVIRFDRGTVTSLQALHAANFLNIP